MVLETEVQSRVKSYQRFLKWCLFPPGLKLNIMTFGSRVSGSIQIKELCPPLHLSEVRGAYDKFPDFFRMGTFIDSSHMKLESPSK